MKVIRPIAITDAMLLSSSVPENDYAVWSSATTYAVGNRVIKGHRIWESLQAANLNKDPETDKSVPPWWLRVSSTNRWRMFDEAVNSQTTATVSMVVEVQPGAVNTVGLVELTGSNVRVQLFDGTTLVYDSMQSIDDTPIYDWWSYFYEVYNPASTLIFQNVPSYLNGRIVVTVTGSSVGCGELVFGTSYDLGETKAGASAGITDYSRKTTNEFGVVDIVQRAYSKRASVQVLLDADSLRRTQALLANLRSTPCLWVGETNTLRFSPLVIYGFFRDFQLEIPGPVLALCSLEIEGMI